MFANPTTTSTIPALSVIQKLLESSEEQDTHKADFVQPVKSLSFDDQSKLQIKADFAGLVASMPGLDPTDWAWRQMFARLGPTVFGKGNLKVLPFDYLTALRPDLRAHVLNDHIQQTDGDWMVRAFDDTCRAVLSDRYAAISNTELLRLLSEISAATNQPHTITHSSSVSPDSLNVRIIWRNIDTPDNGRGNGNWGVGVYIGNGETGNKKARVLPLIQRHSCSNSIIVNSDMAGLELMHRGSAASKRVLIKSAMTEILPVAAQLLDKMILADEQEIPDFTDVLAGLAKQHNWADDFASNVAIGTEGRGTRAGIVNGVTWAAQKLQSDDDRVDAEILGGSLLVAPDSVFHRAAVLAMKDR